MTHEFGHIKQYYDWDPATYTAFGIRRMMGINYKHQEWNADARSGQVDYLGPRRDVVKLLWAINNSDGDPLLTYLLFNSANYILDKYYY